MSTKFGVGGSSRLPFKAQTHRHTDTHTKLETPLTTLPTQRE